MDSKRTLMSVCQLCAGKGKQNEIKGETKGTEFIKKTVLGIVFFEAIGIMTKVTESDSSTQMPVTEWTFLTLKPHRA
jgi:hypothetical protein